MEVTVLGSGTATPSLKRNASGLAVRSSGSLILVDIGPGTMRRMSEAGIDSTLIDAILITHFHPDHVSDLVPFLFASNYAFGPVREEPFYLIGPQGLEHYYEGLVAVYQHWIVPTGERLLRKELLTDKPDSFSLDGLKIRSVPSVHTSPSLSYRIDADGVSVTISGDTDVSDDLSEMAAGTDLFICECSMPDGKKVPGHLVPSEAGRMAAKASAKKLLLTHLYPPCEEVDVVRQAASHFSGEIEKARDLMVISL
ncbi:MAG: MBL fold metallo-hydrolase [Deltaproteobacteria bacterium]